MDNCKTESNERFRKMEENLMKIFANIQKVNNTLKKICKELVMVSVSRTLMELALKHCKDNAVQKWLKENSESMAFFKLVDMFCFLHEEIDKQREKIDKEHIDIIFVAHGSIKEPLIQASCLLPLPTIQDVILYSPWNCLLMTDAIYGITTGRLQPQHRIFSCRKDKGCEIPDKDHQPTKLPNHWNSMKKAGAQKIPNIHVSPLTPEDGVWESIILLQDKHGRPGRNRITVPFMLPGEEESIPFYVVTLALSLVLHYSNLKATLHLAACLGGSSQTWSQKAEYLNQQYSYTINETRMTSSEKMLDESYLSRIFKTWFGS